MVAAFTHNTGMIGLHRRSSSQLFLSSHDYQTSNLNSFLTSVTVFDGSDLTAVVRSNTFWSTLSSKLPYFIAAELLSTLTFVAIAYVLAKQGQFLIDKVSSDAQKPNQFKRLDDISPPVKLDLTKLLLCIVIDTLGTANEAVPLVDPEFSPFRRQIIWVKKQKSLTVFKCVMRINCPWSERLFPCRAIQNISGSPINSGK